MGFNSGFKGLHSDRIVRYFYKPDVQNNPLPKSFWQLSCTLEFTDERVGWNIPLFIGNDNGLRKNQREYINFPSKPQWLSYI